MERWQAQLQAQRLQPPIAGEYLQHLDAVARLRGRLLKKRLCSLDELLLEEGGQAGGECLRTRCVSRSDLDRLLNAP